MAVRSALLDVPGVTRVQVSLEEKEALVTYDARLTTVDALVAAVNSAPHPVASATYTAGVREAPRPARSSP